MHVAVVTIIGGRASINAGKGAGGGAVGRASFCGLIRADSKRRCWPRAPSDPSPKGNGIIFGISNKQTIAVDRVNVDADLVTEV